MNITTKQGKQAVLTIDTKAQTVVTTVEGVSKLTLFVRNNKIVIKNDMLLNDGDLSYAKNELGKTLKKVELTGKKRK